MKKNNSEIIIWYECDYSGGPDWSLIDLVKNWPNTNQNFKLFVNSNHEGLNLLKSKIDYRFNVISLPKYFFYSYWNQYLKTSKKINFFLPLRIISFVFSFVAIFFLSTFIFATNKSDAIIFSSGAYPGGFSNFPAMLSAFLLRKKKKWMVVRSHVVRIPLLKLFNIITKVSLNGIVAISKIIKRELVEMDCFDKKKITVIYPGIDDKKKQDTNINKIFNKNNFVVGIVGHLSKRKGHETLIRAINNVHKDYKKIRLIIIGSNLYEPGEKSSRKYYLKKLIKEIGITKIVFWKNYSKNIFTEIKNMDLLVLPSIKDESFGRVLVEAMASGVAVIGSNTGGIPEIISNNQNGLLFKMGSHEDLSKKIKYIITNNKLRQKIIKNGKKSFLKLFSVNIYVKKYYNLLKI